MINAGHDQAKSEHYYGHHGSPGYGACTAFEDPKTRQEYWDNWEIVTGEKAPPEVRDNEHGGPFTCCWH